MPIIDASTSIQNRKCKATNLKKTNEITKIIDKALYDNRPVAAGVSRGSVPVCPPNWVVPRKICFIHIIITKIFSPKIYFAPKP